LRHGAGSRPAPFDQSKILQTLAAKLALDNKFVGPQLEKIQHKDA
jgi:hypothetical protein